MSLQECMKMPGKPDFQIGKRYYLLRLATNFSSVHRQLLQWIQPINSNYSR